MSLSNSSSIKIGTYNILNPFHAVKWKTAEGLNEEEGDNWDTWRKSAILNNLAQAPLDICALQELSIRTHPQLAQARLGGYETSISRLYTHATQEIEGAHGVAVLYRKDRFKLIADRVLKTPIDDYRCATCVDLKDLTNQRIYRVISAHIKGYNPYEEVIEVKRAEQSRGDEELLHYLEQCSQDTTSLTGTFLLGDFNEDATEMKARGISSRQGQLISKSFIWTGDYAPTETRTGRQIDWIFYQPNSQDGVHQDELCSLSINQELKASDHALTAVELRS